MADRLRIKIKQGHIKPGNQVGSELGLMRDTGLSRTSVRKAIEALVSEGLVERRPGKGIFARRTDVKTRMIEVVVPHLRDSLAAGIAQGVQDFVQSRGVQIRIHNAQGDMEYEISEIRQLPDRHMHGAVIHSLPHPRFAQVIYELKAADFPFVVIDEPVWGLPIATVMSDSYGGGYKVGQELLARGHRRIGFLGNLAGSKASQRRVEGLLHAINDGGFPFDRGLIRDLEVEPLGDWSEAIDRHTRELMSRTDRPTALFYVCDGAAAHGYRTLKAMGLDIPNEVSVVGFDDEPMCEFLDPPLTTVRQPTIEMGHAAAERLLQMIGPRTGRMVPQEGHVCLPVTWVPRASVAVIAPS